MVTQAVSQPTAQKYARVGTIVGADIGSVHTRVVLVDMVEGQYRVISRAQSLTTAAPPVGDVGVGLRRALEQISENISRTFVNSGNEIMVGVPGAIDTFLATASGGRPMRVVMVGLTPDVSLASGRRALASTYAELVETLSVNDIRSLEVQVNTILRHEPDLIFIVGGTNDGATEPMLELLRTVQLACLLARGDKPAVLYAGNEALRPTLREMLGQEVRLFVTDNVRPDLHNEVYEPVQLELALVYGEYRAAAAGGFGEIQRLSELGTLPTAQGYSNAVRYLGEIAGAGVGAGVLCVDVGSSTVTVTAYVGKQLHVTIRPDLGLGHSAVSAVKAVGAGNVARWLSFKATDVDILDYAWNKTLRPSTVPQTAQDLEFEYAIARELIKAAVGTSRSGWRGVGRGELLPAMRPIVGAGSILAQPINPGIGALLLLDALQPVGVVDLKLDPYGLLPILGAVSYVEPLATVQALETGGLMNLATAICPSGRPQGSIAMEVSVKLTSGRTVKRAVPTGSLTTIPIPAGQKAQVTIKLSRGLTLNGRTRFTMGVVGSAAGLICDGRGRPFIVPKDIERRAATLPKWYAAVQTAAPGG